MMEIDTQQYKDLGNFIKRGESGYILPKSGYRIRPGGVLGDCGGVAMGRYRGYVYTWLEQGRHIQISLSVAQ